MSDFENARTSRTVVIPFAHGTATIQVDHWGSDDKAEANRAVDHLLGTAVHDTYAIIGKIAKSVAPPAGHTKHVSTRSMNTGGSVTMRIKVTLVLTYKAMAISAAAYVSKILSGAELCALHLVDPTALDEIAEKFDEGTDSLLGALRAASAGMPADIRDALFGPGSPFGGSSDGTPYESAGYRY